MIEGDNSVGQICPSVFVGVMDRATHRKLDCASSFCEATLSANTTESVLLALSWPTRIRMRSDVIPVMEMFYGAVRLLGATVSATMIK